MAAELCAGVRGHAATDSYGEMVVAREGPDVAFKLWKKFDGDGIGDLRDEVALGHFQLVTLERAASRHELIASARGEDQKFRVVPFPFETITGLARFFFHAQHT